ncbi:MAG: hypothetical protein ACFFFK_05230 [Candidatus Thorarchaeota archaeon]
MRHSPSRLVFIGLMILVLVMLPGNITTVDAQTSNPIADSKLAVYVTLDGMNFYDYNQTNPMPINTEAPMYLDMDITNTWTQTLNVTGVITIYYQGFPIAPIPIREAGSPESWFEIPANTTVSLPAPAEFPFSDILNVIGPIKLATGIFEASIEFKYTVDGNTTLNTLTHRLSFSLPSTPFDVITSVTGIATSVATVGAIYGVATGFNSLWEGLKTAYKLRGIHKKASELRSLPNLTVLGALPLLFSLLDTMKKGKKEGREDSGVSEYIVRQRLREAAPDAWQVDKCPQCKRNWNKKLDMCKKCNIGQEEARIAYAELLTTKVPTALRYMGKKKSTDVKTLAKKTKSTQYNAGVIAAAMVDTNVTEITKVGTPSRSFIMNIAGLAFLVVTWQQLLGDSSSTWQTTITMVGAALSLAVIIALYFTRKTQIAKFVADQEAGKKLLPTDEETEAESKAEDINEESQTEEDEDEEETTSVVETSSDTEDFEDTHGPDSSEDTDMAEERVSEDYDEDSDEYSDDFVDDE